MLPFFAWLQRGYGIEVFCITVSLHSLPKKRRDTGQSFAAALRIGHTMWVVGVVSCHGGDTWEVAYVREGAGSWKGISEAAAIIKGARVGVEVDIYA